MSVAQFVAGVDRLLTRGYGEAVPAGAPGDGGQVFAAGGGGGSVPGAPAGGDSGLAGGAAAAGGAYQQAQAGADGLDGDAGQAVTQAVRLVLRAGPHRGLFVIRPARWGRRVRRWAARRRGRSW